ncbi:hypothetical protein HY604_03610 [Candidatus Peregrinibacteria bacterium]|nr:hypothetical protein [Candidatus Peregrinibacteria bacterium]
MSDSVGFLKKYFISIIAALIVIAVAVASFVYSLIVGTEDNSAFLIEKTDTGIMIVEPGAGAVPSGPPNVEAPTSAAPLN